jgi:hypothetical protein
MVLTVPSVRPQVRKATSRLPGSQAGSGGRWVVQGAHLKAQEVKAAAAGRGVVPSGTAHIHEQKRNPQCKGGQMEP